MEAYLVDIKVGYKDDIYTSIIMKFASSMDSLDLYNYKTSLYTQYCSKEDREKEELSDDEINKYLQLAYSQIGNKFIINLYKISVKELTNNLYVAFCIDGEKIVKDYYMASYMSKEDVIKELLLLLLYHSFDFNFNLMGVLPNGKREDLSADLIPLLKINNREHYYPTDCKRADEEYLKKVTNNFGKKYLNEFIDKSTIVNERINFSHSLSVKYKGKTVIKMI